MEKTAINAEGWERHFMKSARMPLLLPQMEFFNGLLPYKKAPFDLHQKGLHREEEG